MKITLEEIHEFREAVGVDNTSLVSVRDADGDKPEHVEVSIPLINNNGSAEDITDSVLTIASSYGLELIGKEEHDFLVLCFVDAD